MRDGACGLLRKSYTSRVNSGCKGPNVRVCFRRSRDIVANHVAGVEHDRRRGQRDDGARLRGSLVRMGRALALTEWRYPREFQAEKRGMI